MAAVSLVRSKAVVMHRSSCVLSSRRPRSVACWMPRVVSGHGLDGSPLSTPARKHFVSAWRATISCDVMTGSIEEGLSLLDAGLPSFG
jgi:hypothetical protein